MSANGNGYHHANGNGNGTGHGIALEDRQAPQNIEAELGLLSSILIDNDVLPEVRRIIGADDFFRDRHQVIFRAMCQVADAGIVIDAVSLTDELVRSGQYRDVGGSETLTDIGQAAPHAANAVYYAGVVLNKSKARSAIDILSGSLNAAYAQQEPSEDLIRRVSDSLGLIGLPPEDEPDEFGSIRPWPDPPAPALFHGLAGEAVRLISPHTEADPMALLGQFLVAFGNVVGRYAHWQAEATAHFCNLYVCVVGNSSKARKGTSWEHVRNLFRSCDHEWANRRITQGLASGEGLMWEVRDPVVRRERRGGKNSQPVSYEEIQVDVGIDDKRALFVESEFGSTLAIMSREGNSLSGIVRQAWDSGRLKAASKNNPVEATGAHVSIIGHVTSEELHRRLTSTDAANGFANRFLWICARRARLLPHGGRIWESVFTDLFRQLSEAITFARTEFVDDSTPMCRDASANALWEEVYPSLSEAKAGLLGAVTSRAEAQTMRIACIYALLDCSKWIRRHHLEAGLAFWRYCEQSAAYIFGDALGDVDTDRLLKALRDAGEKGLGLTQIRRTVFRGHKSTDEIADKLGTLARAGLAVSIVDASTKRPTTLWRSVGPQLVTQNGQGCAQGAQGALVPPQLQNGNGESDL
jgi:hypothetical protein